ncbi:MAG: hypothetical protein M9894_04390 [Planctomycetes bacterium]|nr:hypothetical protein [Planctomycetota bacterium]
MATPSSCRFCAEPLPPDAATRCPHCGEALRPEARLRWEPDRVVVEAPGDLPTGVCFGCAAAPPSGSRRLFGPRGVPVDRVDVPGCAACHTRARLFPLAVMGALGTIGLSLPMFTLLVELRAPVAAFVVPIGLFAAAGGLAAAALRLAATRVSVRWSVHEATLLLPDAPAVRRAVERAKG